MSGPSLFSMLGMVQVARSMHIFVYAQEIKRRAFAFSFTLIVLYSKGIYHYVCLAIWLRSYQLILSWTSYRSTYS